MIGTEIILLTAFTFVLGIVAGRLWEKINNLSTLYSQPTNKLSTNVDKPVDNKSELLQTAGKPVDTSPLNKPTPKSRVMHFPTTKEIRKQSEQAAIDEQILSIEKTPRDKGSFAM